MLRFILFSFILLPVLAKTQGIIPEFRNQLKLSPLRYIDWSNPGVELSYQRLHPARLLGAKYHSTQLSVTYVKKLIVIDDNPTPVGYKVSLEEKFYNGRKKTRMYLAGELIYLNGKVTQYTRERDSIDFWSFHNKDTFYIRREIGAVNAKWGVEYFYKQLVFDLSIGYGIKYRLNEPIGRKNPEMDGWGLHKWQRDLRKYGTTYTINVPINIKIGFAF